MKIREILTSKNMELTFPAAIEVFHDQERIETVDDRQNYGEERLQL